MRYSEVLLWYGITLPEAAADTVDCFFTLASEHHDLLRRSIAIEHEVIHLERRSAYLEAMKKIIRETGEFQAAVDRSGHGLHMRKNWIGPDLPDPNCFGAMPGCSWRPGDDLPSDFIYLPSLVTQTRLVRLAS